MNSPAEYLALLPAPLRQQLIDSQTEAELAARLYTWRFWARPSQLPPGSPNAAIERDDWLFWLVQAGRGFGKTRTGAETVREWAANPKERILMIAPTASDVRETMIEGPSGLMACYPQSRKPDYNPSRHLVTFASGAIGITRSADEPERLRGPQFTKFWADELCAWRFAKLAWDQIMFGFRLPGARLQGVITTTPKPMPVLKEIAKNPQTVVTRGSSNENRSNLSDAFFQNVIAPYIGTRLGRQEIDAEILEDTPGALWTRGIIEAARISAKEAQDHAELVIRIVVAIDPAVTASEDSDETGIVVVGLTRSGHILVYDDLSLRDTPLKWASVAINALRLRRGDRIVGEVNNGGDLVESNIRTIDRNVPFRAVRASRGKQVRAEPVAAMYEQGRVHHVGSFPMLEDEMCNWIPGMRSPSRMDALVWGITELAIDTEAETVRLVYPPYQISPI
jgi:phage terminase large subunit-like protein